MVALIRAVDSWKMAIDRSEKVVCAFLDLKKAFDVVDHNVLLQKLAQHGVTGKEHEWFESYLSGRLQFVSCDGTDSEQLTITYGIPQGSVLGPTLFNIHIDSISDVCDSCDIVLYADDTGIHTSSKDVKIAEQYVNEDLGRVTDRLSTDGLICNHKKSEAILIGSKHAVKNAPDLQIIMDGRLLKQCEDFKYLGVYIDNTLSWNKHITYLASRIYPKLKMLNRIAPFLSQRVLLNIYKQTILPIVDYGCIVWGDCGKNNSQRLERLQNQAMRTILSTNRNTCSQEMRSKLSLLSLESRRRFLRLNLVFKIIHNINCPQQLENYLLKRSAFHTRDFRDSTLLNIVATKTKMGQTSFKCTAAREWNLLPKDIREIQSLSKFKAIVFEYFLEHDKSNHLCSLK